MTHQGRSKHIFLTWLWPWKCVWFETADKLNNSHIYIPSAFQRAACSLLCLMLVSGLGDGGKLALKAKLMLCYARQCFYPKWKSFYAFKGCLINGTGPEKSQGEKSAFVKTSPVGKCSFPLKLWKGKVFQTEENVQNYLKNRQPQAGNNWKSVFAEEPLS